MENESKFLEEIIKKAGNNKESLKMALEIIDININEWQFYAKCNNLLCDLALNVVNVLVDEKMKIVEKCLKLEKVLSKDKD